MRKGEVMEYDNKVVLQDLLNAGFVEEVAENTPKGGRNESKRNTSK